MYYVRFKDGDLYLSDSVEQAFFIYEKSNAVSFGKVLSNICFQELKGNFADSLVEFDEDGCPVCKEVSDVKQKKNVE